jgi:hypothetical protein
MPTSLILSFALVAATVAIHATGLTGLLHFVAAEFKRASGRPKLTWLLIRIVWILIAIHGIEICVWAFAYRLSGSLPDLNTAFYFSGTTYTTIGYGDYVLSPPWRMLAPVEGMTGILMCSLSGAFFFAVVSKALKHRFEKE